MARKKIIVFNLKKIYNRPGGGSTDDRFNEFTAEICELVKTRLAYIETQSSDKSELCGKHLKTRV